MQLEELCLEGIHVKVRPEWRERAELELRRLEAHHPGRLARVRIVFTPVRNHEAGIEVRLDGHMNHHPFHVQRHAEDALVALHLAFDVVRRNLEERMAE